MKTEIRELLQIRESSRAKRLKLKYRKGQFTVVKPENTDLDIDTFIENNIDWIESRLEEAKNYRKQLPERDFSEGATISVLGKDREIMVESRRSSKVEDDILLAQHLVERTSIRNQVEKTLREHARETIHQKLEKYSSKIDGEYNKVFIRDQETRWGSCSSKNNLNFNWRLVLGPEHVLEYVVVHELVHLEISNHGKGFESRVDQLFPGKDKSQKWLDKNAAKLEFDY